MEIKNDFIHIWTNGHCPVLFAKVSSTPEDNSAFDEFMEVYLRCIRSQAKKFPVLYTVSDFSAISPPQLSVVVQFYAKYIPVQLALGIRFKAFVQPRNLFSQFALEDVIKNSDPATIGVFASLEEATHAVMKMDESFRTGTVSKEESDLNQRMIACR